MQLITIIAILLIGVGAVGLVYSKITYTKDTHDTKLGPIELSYKDRESVNVPVWLGAGAITVGVIMLLTL